jgi:signal transduction histidine kinase
MIQLPAEFQTICDFIRDASTPIALMNNDGVCVFQNPSILRLNLKDALEYYFLTEAGKKTLQHAAYQSTPTPFSFLVIKNRQKASIRRILPNSKNAIFAIQLLQSERMAAFTMASHSEQIAALENYQKRLASDRFEAFFKTGRDGKAILTRAGKFLYANPAMLRLLNTELEELHQKTFFEIFDNLPTQIAEHLNDISKADLGNYIPSKFDAVLKSGTGNIPVSVTLESNGFEKNLEVFLSLRDLTASHRFAEVQKLNKELDKANKEMDEFNRLMSHEMRAPLSRLVSVAENLRGINNVNPEVSKYINIMEEAAKDALLQYSAILSLSRGGKREIAPLQLMELEKRLLRQHSLFAEYHNINLTSVVVGDTQTDIPVDTTDAFLIMTNLISNALKHTESGDSVVFTIAASSETKKLHLEVQDTGSGISEELQPKIYDAFVTTSGGMEIQSGIGVGLSIVRRTVENCGGEISFTSETGKGTTFIVSLPFVAHSAQKLKNSNESAAPDGPKLGPNEPILIIDDDMVNLQVLSARIKAAGYSPITATNGTEALKILKSELENWPRLIFIDRNMPGLNGLEIARIIRTQHSDKETFICGLTAYVDDEIRAEMEDAGIDRVEQKPINQKTLEKYAPRHEKSAMS